MNLTTRDCGEDIQRWVLAGQRRRQQRWRNTSAARSSAAAAAASSSSLFPKPPCCSSGAAARAAARILLRGCGGLLRGPGPRHPGCCNDQDRLLRGRLSSRRLSLPFLCEDRAPGWRTSAGGLPRGELGLSTSPFCIWNV